MGSLKKRSPGSWTIWWYATDPVSGKRVQKTATIRGTKEEALKELRARERAADDRMTHSPTGETVFQYMARWIDSRALKKNTTNRYRGILERQIAPAFGAIRMDRLTPARVQEAYSVWLQTLSPATVIQAHRILKQSFAAAVRLGELASNPLDRVEPPKTAKQPPRVMPLSSALAVMEYVEEWARVALTIALHTGMRRSEIIALKWEDWDGGKIHVRAGVDNLSKKAERSAPKTERSLRTVELGPAAREALENWRRAIQADAILYGITPSPFIFPRYNGAMRHPRSLTDAWRNAARKLGVKARLHDLRHTHASHLLALGVPLPTVSARLGHASPAVTASIYAHDVEGQQKRAAEAFDALAIDSKTTAKPEETEGEQQQGKRKKLAKIIRF